MSLQSYKIKFGHFRILRVREILPSFDRVDACRFPGEEGVSSDRVVVMASGRMEL
jgi:hypothetical protein